MTSDHVPEALALIAEGLDEVANGNRAKDIASSLERIASSLEAIVECIGTGVFGKHIRTGN